MTDNDSYLYGKDAVITANMTDAYGILRVSDALRLMQDAASEQLEALGPDEKTLRARHRAFFISRISMDFPLPLRRFDCVTAETYPAATSFGASFDRCYRLLRKENGHPFCAVRAVSQWAMIDTDTRRLVRIRDSGFTGSRDEPMEVSVPLRFRIPRDAALVRVGEKTVRYSDTDTNGHMNNTHYPDLVCDHLPVLNRLPEKETGDGGEMCAYRVTAFAAAFLREAPLGETLDIFRTETPDDTGLYLFRTVRRSDGETNMECAVRAEICPPAAGQGDIGK